MTVTHIVPEAVLQACRVLLAEDIKIKKLWNDICSARAELAHFKRDLHHQVFGATLERLQIEEAKLKRTETILRRRWRLIDANMQTARSQLQAYFGDQSHSFEFVQTFGQAIAATKQRVWPNVSRSLMPSWRNVGLRN